jgi:predicted phosphodiesterase
MLDDLAEQDYDAVVCLGDHAQGGPQPGETLDLLRELGCPAVYGNSDHFLLTLDPGEEEVSETQLDTARWSQSQLTDEQLQFHRSFRPTVRLDLGGGRSLLAFHGTPRSRDEIVGPWMEEPDFRAAFADEDAFVYAGGHTHQQWARRLGDAYYVNPGSVGLPVDHLQDVSDPRADHAAEYALLTVDRGVTVEFRRIPFDPAEVVRAVEAAGMPHPDNSARTWR